jgi:hypothetical protein
MYVLYEYLRRHSLLYHLNLGNKIIKFQAEILENATRTILSGS